MKGVSGHLPQNVRIIKIQEERLVITILTSHIITVIIVNSELTINMYI